jgi:nitroreductase
MNVETAIRQRHSTRAFLDTPVSKEQVIQLLDIARYTPSGVNMQPWEVSVLTGKTKETLSKALIEAFRSQQRGETEKAKMDIQYYPSKWITPFKQRRVETGHLLYSALNISREDKARRLEQWEANYRSFDAPVMLLFWIDDSLAEGSLIDYGMFWQSLMLAAAEQGLATCPQGALAEFPDLTRQHLNIPANKKLIGGMALGYEDPSHPVNQYRTPREPVENFTQFFE